tara:strand:+ start:368 stop:478 length:111 start_codon:yes stop_codon:yes gene_type:complete
MYDSLVKVKNIHEKLCGTVRPRKKFFLTQKLTKNKK